MAQLKVGQHFHAVIENVLTADGRPTTLENIVWSVDNTAAIRIEPSADGMSADLFGDAPTPKDADDVDIPANVTVVADGRPGEGVKQFVATAEGITVVPNDDAATAVINLGAPIDA